jgi:hypothetical protein
MEIKKRKLEWKLGSIVLAISLITILISPGAAFAAEDQISPQEINVPTLGNVESGDDIYDEHHKPVDVLGFTDSESGPFTSCAEVIDVPQAECEALVDLYNTTGGDNWTNNSGWLQTNEVCSWYGIYCDVGLEDIDLDNNNLVGTLNVDFSDITNLMHLDLENNNLDGDMTTIMSHLPLNVTTLDFENNSFTGTIPPTVSTS